jgi:hypothetical protein
MAEPIDRPKWQRKITAFVLVVGKPFTGTRFGESCALFLIGTFS